MNYLCKLHWTWGGNFSETTEFFVYERDEIKEKAEEIIVKIARRYAFDCGRLEKPLNPLVSSITVIPYTEGETIFASDIGLDEFMDAEVVHTRWMIEQGQQFVDGGYNLARHDETS